MKYLLVAIIMNTAIILGSSLPDLETKLNKKCSFEIQETEKDTSGLSGKTFRLNKSQQVVEPDSIEMESKKWMMKQNMIIIF